MSSKLSRHLQCLLEFLSERGLQPPAEQILIVEITNARATDAGRPRIARQELLRPESFEAKFDELLSTGRRWVNLSCVGVDGDFLVVSVEAGPRDSAAGPTSVNYSGPTAAALQHGWHVSKSLLIE
jgi:hypothetical protein